MVMSAAAIRAAQRENSPDAFLCLLTFILSPAGQPDIRIVNNTVDIVSRGNTFIGCPFAVMLPEATDQTVSGASIEVDNVDARIWAGVRALTFAPDVRLEIVLASQPDTLLYDVDGLKLREASADRTTLRGKLVPDTIWTSGFPAHDFDPPQFQGMFGT